MLKMFHFIVFPSDVSSVTTDVIQREEWIISIVSGLGIKHTAK